MKTTINHNLLLHAVCNKRINSNNNIILFISMLTTLSISDRPIQLIGFLYKQLTDRIKVKIFYFEQKFTFRTQNKIQIFTTQDNSNQTMSIADIKKSIQTFLEKNNLHHTLQIFKNQNSSQLQKGKNMISPSKPLICINKKQAYQIQKLSTQKLDFQNPQTQNQLRQHLQRTDIDVLRKVFQRIKKSTAKNIQKNQYATKSGKNITEMNFFKKLMEKQEKKSEKMRDEIIFRRNNNPLLDQSRQYDNEWKNPAELGYDINEFYNSDFAQVCKQLKAIRSPEYLSQIIKQVSFPQSYYSTIASYKQRNNFNINDKFYSRLPPNVKFAPHSIISKGKQSKRGFEQNELNSISYPMQMHDIVYDSYELKIIYDRDKTGFEQQRDIKIVINQVLAGRYQIVSNLGQAQFSNAIQVKDLTNQQRYCLKIIHNNKQYFDQSLDQIKILRYIKANCNPDQKYLLNLHDFFYHKEHLMLMTDLLKDTLLHAYQMNRQMFTNLRTVQIITRQILIGLEQLHELHIAHTDLKPENIMIRSYTNKTVKIIDLGSSVFFHDEPTYYIQTRSYRAPEVILGLPYDGKIDIWSLGCIIAEVFMGELLFDAQSQAALLTLIQGLRGPWPSWMLEKGLKVTNYFTKDMFIYEQILDEKKNKTGKSRIYTSKLTNMRARVNSDNKSFIDFLSKCLKIDPNQRMSAKQAMNHPFITEPIFG